MAKQVRYDMIGPVDVPMETNSGLVLLPTNKTLMVMPFKGDKAPRRPEEVPAEFAKSTEDVMDWAQPEVKVNLKTGNPDNPESPETIRYRKGIESFSPSSIKRNSKTLRKLESEFKASELLVDRISKSAQFRKALDDPETRAAIVQTFQELIAELETSIPAEPE